MEVRILHQPPIMDDYDYRYSEEAFEHDLKIIWKCDSCGIERQEPIGMNEGGLCSCGGNYCEAGESYIA